MEALLSLGSNVGDRLAWLVAACAAIARLPDTCIVAKAPIYDTEPVDTQPAWQSHTYLNTVLAIETTLNPEQLSDAVHGIETALGRVRGADRNVPREIDIDLIACGKQRRSQPGLFLPHPQATRRRFVCQPLADIRPELILPGERRTVRELLASLPASPSVMRADDQWPDS